MQTMPEEWPSLTRMLSSCRHSKKVSCETLSLIDVDSHSFYYSDDEKDHRKEEPTIGEDEVSELENPSHGYSNLANDYLHRARELERHNGKLDNPSYGDGKAAGHKFLPCFPSKTSHMPAAHRVKEVERLNKHLRAYPGAIHGTGGVIPHSVPILLPLGSHSGGPVSSKGAATLRASSIIPRNAVAGWMNPSGAAEPSSPKVTCLGRVGNKQKHIGKGPSAIADDTKRDQLNVLCTSMLKRREKKKAYTEVVESAFKKEKKTSRMGSGNAMVVDHCVEQRKETDCEKASQKLTAQKPGGKGTVSSWYVAKKESKRWSLRETSKHEESTTSFQHQRKWQAGEASATGASSREGEFPIDLRRFGWEESQKGHEMMVRTSLVGNGLQRFEQDDEQDSVQAPPRNALLLIRNRKAKDNSEVFLSSSSNGQEKSLPTALGDHVGTMPTSVPHEYDQFSPQAETKKPVTIADVLGQISSPRLTLKMGNASSMACQSERFQNKFSLQTEYSGVHRRASLRAPSPEASLWQRRAVAKPCALDLKRRVKSEIISAPRCR